MTTTMSSWEMILVLPPLVRFFMGFFLILSFYGGALTFTWWISKDE